MRRGGRVLVILGMVLAVIAGGGVYVVLANAEPQAEPVKTTKLVMSVQNIVERSEVAPEQVAQVDWPVTIPTPVGAFEKPTDAVGKFALVPIYPGQPLVAGMLIDKSQIKDTHSNAALLLEKGSVAIALPVTANTEVADAIQAGDRVDILATFTAQPVTTGNQSAGQPLVASHRLLQNVLILQIGPWPNPGTKSQGGAATTVVTLQLNEQDALVLKYSLENSNGLTLVLRPANDTDLANPEPVTLEYINKRFGYRFPATGK
jgi:Flp pilus assembly protein CpaB